MSKDAELVKTDDLIDALSDPSAYPCSVAAVEVRQTHISVVFLVDSLAYKIKRPVSTGFADYSTPERRRHFCEEELRLNRRLATEVYLAVVPVTSEGGVIRMEGSGQVVEWAVKMKRLPDAATLGSRLERDELGAEALEELARRLAEFHAGADSGPEIAAGASFDSVARNVSDNFDQAAPEMGITLSRPVRDRLAILTNTTLDRLRSLVDDRAARGIPRDTHGDLRLDHIYWFPEREPPSNWVIVDCIEFDQRYRHADPIADIAFLAMELIIRGHGDLATVFAEAYLTAAADEQGRPLIPFYMSYRSMVRGKVRGMQSTDPQLSGPDRAETLQLARAHWLFALGELETANRRPGLVLVAGLPGAGKSTLAGDLAERAGFTLIRSDKVRKELLGQTSKGTSPAVFGGGLYTADWNEQTYAECLRRAEELLFEGNRVLVDATFREQLHRRLFLEVARRWAIPVCLIHCQADPDVVRERLASRRDDASDADAAIHAEIARRWEEPDLPTRQLTRVIDTSGTRSHSLAQAIGVLQEFGLQDGVG
jgi:aminoglycoside phosphotransferase family enzyme/predicted kinase